MRNRYYRPRRSPMASPFLLGGLVIGTAVFGIGNAAIQHTTWGASMAAMLPATCDIKGNISVETGERIYHVPGQKFYDQTTIRREYGEEMFCSEAEARAAGWRKSKR